MGSMKLLYSTVYLSILLTLSVTKTFVWATSSQVLMVKHLYLACMILVARPFSCCDMTCDILTQDNVQHA